MTSKVLDVPAYMEGVPPARRASISKIRDLCLQNLDGYLECMEYGMPAYKRNGVVEFAWASQKQYIALYVMKKDVVDEFRAALSGADIGKGCIRFKNPDKIDYGVLKRLLRRTVESKSPAC